jgi:peroxiredoxin
MIRSQLLIQWKEIRLEHRAQTHLKECKLSLTASRMVGLGTRPPDFRLPDTDGSLVSRADFDSCKGLLLVFMCNHCPYVRHIRRGLAEFADRNISSDFAMVGINANDATSHPGDSPERMKEEVNTAGYHFPYLHDESQDVARAYGAECTPDFFLFDKDRGLVYRGQFDDSRPGNDIPVTGSDLQSAVDALLEGRVVSGEQTPSVGCNIKWKAA